MNREKRQNKRWVFQDLEFSTFLLIFNSFRAFCTASKHFHLKNIMHLNASILPLEFFILHHTAVQLGSKSFLCFSFDICSMRPGSITWFGTFTHMIKARLHFLVILPNRIVFHLFFIRSQCLKISQKLSFLFSLFFECSSRGSRDPSYVCLSEARHTWVYLWVYIEVMCVLVFLRSF